MFEKLKDTIYDKSDIIVAFALIIAAGFLIFNRVESIMSYPEILAAELQELEDNESAGGDVLQSDEQDGTDTAQNSSGPSQQGDSDGSSEDNADVSDPNGSGSGTTSPTGVQAPSASDHQPTNGDTSNSSQAGSSGTSASSGTSGSNASSSSGNSSGGNSASGSSNSTFATSVQRTVTIPSGSTSSTIASILTEAGVVPSKDAFQNAVSAANADTKLKAGTFTIPAGSSVSDVVNIITH